MYQINKVSMKFLNLVSKKHTVIINHSRFSFNFRNFLNRISWKGLLSLQYNLIGNCNCIYHEVNQIYFILESITVLHK